MKLSKTYQIHEFAELTGVTVKALHHYDRLGLLKPQRALSGYRLYVERDLERLEQIVALKFLGFPLQEIKAVLDRAALKLPEAGVVAELRIQEGYFAHSKLLTAEKWAARPLMARTTQGIARLADSFL